MPTFKIKQMDPKPSMVTATFDYDPGTGQVTNYTASEKRPGVSCVKIDNNSNSPGKIDFTVHFNINQKVRFQGTYQPGPPAKLSGRATITDPIPSNAAGSLGSSLTWHDESPQAGAPVRLTVMSAGSLKPNDGITISGTKDMDGFYVVNSVEQGEYPNPSIIYVTSRKTWGVADCSQGFFQMNMEGNESASLAQGGGGDEDTWTADAGVGTGEDQ